MPINASHIKFLASKVMADVPEGGGGPSGVVLQSGVPNNIFNDVTETDRAGGDLSHRQVFMAVQSGDNSVAQDCNVIISQPPDDPNVSIVLMETVDEFATRAQDIAALEAGFVKSGTYHGELFGNHVAGMSMLMIQQRPEAELPKINTRLALVYREGFSNEETQYVSVQRIAGDVVQTFTDANGEFQKRILTVEIGQTLQRAFAGFDAQRTTISASQLNNNTRIRTCVWGNAARYCGIKKLIADAVQNSFTVQVQGIYERLVPSAEAETPLVSLRINQQADALVQAGGPITFTTNVVFNTTTNLAVGGSVTPGTLSITRAGSTLTDEGGKLMLAGAQIGTFDYANGIATLVAAGFPTGGTMTVVYTPAVLMPANVSSAGLQVTAENRRLNYVATFPANAAPGSLQIHYMANGRWYVLTEDGSGRIAGDDAAYGGGNYSRSTRTMAVTLGALPDVGSMFIMTFVQEDDPSSLGGSVALRYDNRVIIPINSDGQISLEPGSKPFTPSSVSITWTDGAATRAVTDNGAGGLTGDGTGTVDYQNGLLILIPNNLPAWGTVIAVLAGRHTLAEDSTSWAGSGASRTCTLGVPPKPGTVRFRLSVGVEYEVQEGHGWLTDEVRKTSTISGEAVDDGSGNLLFFGVNVGSVNYGTGVVSVNVIGKAQALSSAVNQQFIAGKSGEIVLS